MTGWWKARVRRAAAAADGDDGAVAGWEVLPFGLLVFVVGTLLIANVWGVIDAKMASAAAAREGARAFIEADRFEARGDTRRAVWAALEGHGRNPATATVDIEGALRRCDRVIVEVELPVAGIPLPWVGGLGFGLRAKSTHAEVVDPLRSGLFGRANCVD